MNSTPYTITELYIYPIKSLAGIKVQSARAQEMGFENDRRWMLVDGENQFITQRSHPHLSQFYPEINGNKITVNHNDSLHEFSINESLNEALFSKVWDDETIAFEVSKVTSKWFSDILGFESKLVKIANNGDRKHNSSKLNIALNVSLADGYPYLLIGSESLTFLNEKLDEKITMPRFRPNIVFNSRVAHEEDLFTNFKIATVQFKNVKPCGRCIMVNTNPNDGTVKKEPLKTLSTYREADNSVLFGTNVMCINDGIIEVGDALIFDVM